MDIAFAAMRLDIPGLIELANAQLASLIKYEVNHGTTIRDQAANIRRRFMIPDTFPREEPYRTQSMLESEMEW